MVAAIYLSNTVHVLTIKIKDFFKGGGGGIIWKGGYKYPLRTMRNLYNM